MSAKKRGGGRVTPKGTQPASTSKGKADGDAAGNGSSWAPPSRTTPTPGRGTFGPAAPTRSGHHRGNR